MITIFDLHQNVAFGARLGESTKPSKQEGAADGTRATEGSTRTESTVHSAQGDSGVQSETHYHSE